MEPIVDQAPGTKLMVHCAHTVRVVVDGRELGRADAGAFVEFPVDPGEHRVLLETLDGSLRWDGLVKLPIGEQVLLEVPLAPTDPGIGVPGSFRDPADGRDYKTVRLDGLEWFAENYAAALSESVAGRYGRHYVADTVAGGIPGWRLPARGDFERLLRLYSDPFSALMAGGKSGFDIQLAGTFDVDRVEHINAFAVLWSSTAGPVIRDLGRKKHPSLFALYFDAKKKRVTLEHGYRARIKRHSVRFVRNVP